MAAWLAWTRKVIKQIVNRFLFCPPVAIAGGLFLAIIPSQPIKMAHRDWRKDVIGSYFRLYIAHEISPS
jgi:hypothetical protein